MPRDSPYTEEMREAAASAHLDRGATYRRVRELARAGQLLNPAGESVGIFDPPEETIKTWARRERLRAAGKVASPLEKIPHRDAIEILRLRSVNAASKLLDQYDKILKNNPRAADPDRLRQIIRVVREAAALPDKTDPRPAQPGKGPMKDRQGGETTGGLAGRIMRDVQGSAVQDTGRSQEDRQVPETSDGRAEAAVSGGDPVAALRGLATGGTWGAAGGTPNG